MELRIPETKTIESKLQELSNQYLLRKDTAYPCSGTFVDANSTRYVNLSSNDYLNLSQNEEVKLAAANAIKQFGASSSSSRLMTGTLDLHHEFEKNFSEFVSHNSNIRLSSLLCGSGYLANLCMLTSLVGRNDVVFADKLIHASLIDGIRLSGSKLIRFQHNDVSNLEHLLNKANNIRKNHEQFFILTESVFSMDGDLAPLLEIYDIAKRFEAQMLIDDAHAVGVFGDTGCGQVSQFFFNSDNTYDNITMFSATLSKALGSYGGVLCSNALHREWLVNNARPFIYNTSLPPSAVIAATTAIKIITREKNLGETLLNRARLFREILNKEGLNTTNSESQIVPIIIGDNEQTVNFSNALKKAGIIGIAVRSPTVAVNTARVRFSITLGINEKQIEELALNIVSIARSQGLL